MNVIQTIPTTQIALPEESSSYIFELQQYILPETPLSPAGELNWGRLICTWHEKRQKNHVVTHTYAACIDGKEGGIYLDCSPRVIFTKCVGHLFARPLFTIVKTIYQLSLYPIFNEIAKAYHSVQSKHEKIKNIFKSITDILLTPIYGVILTVATVAVLIIGPFAPGNFYEGRKFLGKIEQASNWGQIHTSWTLAKCFQPLPLDVLEVYAERDFSHDTAYQQEGSEEKILIERQLANFARARIRHKKKNLDVLSCSKLPPAAVYQSPVMKKMGIFKIW